jgi:hypothetical protein
MSRVLDKAALFMQNKPNFQNAQMNVISVLTEHYENNRLGRRAENILDQTQFKDPTNTHPLDAPAKTSIIPPSLTQSAEQAVQYEQSV